MDGPKYHSVNRGNTLDTETLNWVKHYYRELLLGIQK
jgi:hypothetical protein